MRLVTTALVALLLVAPARAAAGVLGPISLTLEVWGGGQLADPLHLAGGTAGITPSANDLLLPGIDVFGVSAIAKASFLEVGLSYDSTFTTPTTQLSTLTPLAGLAFDLWWFRVEVLGEYGGHRYGQIAGSKERLTVGFVGVRPGLSLRIPVGPVRLVVGGWFFSRWHLTTYSVAVPAPPPGVGTTVFQNGLGPTWGVAGRLGLEL